MSSQGAMPEIRRVHDDQPFDLVRAARRMGVGDHDADIVGTRLDCGRFGFESRGQ